MSDAPECLLRIDRLMKPAGVVQNAIMYSVFFRSGALHFVKTGPGWRNIYQSGFQRLIADWVIKRQKVKVAQAEKELDRLAWDQLVSQRVELTLDCDQISRIELLPLERLDHIKVKISSKVGGKVHSYEAVDFERLSAVSDFFKATGIQLDVKNG